MAAITHSKVIASGYIGRKGAAKLKFRIHGIKLVGMIDTGFTGFISLPLPLAERFNLTPSGIAVAVMADGAQHVMVTSKAPVKFAGKVREGTVFVEPNANIILVGMDFLHKFHLGLIVTKNKVYLVDEFYEP